MSLDTANPEESLPEQSDLRQKSVGKTDNPPGAENAAESTPGEDPLPERDFPKIKTLETGRVYRVAYVEDGKKKGGRVGHFLNELLDGKVPNGNVALGGLCGTVTKLADNQIIRNDYQFGRETFDARIPGSRSERSFELELWAIKHKGKPNARLYGFFCKHQGVRYFVCFYGLTHKSGSLGREDIEGIQAAAGRVWSQLTELLPGVEHANYR